MSRLRPAAPAALVALAAVSLLAPLALVYDPWAWLVWGRELAALELDTGAGPSWKPLPVLITTLLSPTGDAAPTLWMLIARVGWLASIALAWRLAARLALPGDLPMRIGELIAPRRIARARLAAGAVAAVGMLLLFDPFTSWVRQFAGGLSEPLLVALVLGGVDRELSGRRGQALALGLCAALLRPEAWPFLAAYGVHLWSRAPGLRRWLAAAAVAVPALWLVPDLLGSGDPLTGATRAREASGAPAHELLEAIGRSLDLVLAALWASAGFAALSAWRGRERAIVVLAAGALAWIGVVAILAAAGYAGIPRFSAPAAGVVCVLGGVGAVRLAIALGGAPRGPRGTALAACAAVLALGFAVQASLRGAEIPGELRDARAFERGIDDLFATVDRVGAERIVACGEVSTSDFLSETALAWKLDLPLSEVDLRVLSPPPPGSALVDANARPATRGAVRAAGSRSAEQGSWSAYAISCAARASADGGLAIAGVTGARR